MTGAMRAAVMLATGRIAAAAAALAVAISVTANPKIMLVLSRLAVRSS